MQKNVTLTLDSDLLRAARKIALDRDTSVNQLVREYLTALVKENEHRALALPQLQEIFKARTYEMGPVTWSRDDLHERH